MDGRLWSRLYREIHRACKPLILTGRAGRPRIYETQEVLAVWAFAAMMDWPISVAQRRLATGSAGWWLRRHWFWPARVPSLPTLTRRARATDFRWLLRQVIQGLRRRLHMRLGSCVFMDSTILSTGFYSHDPDSKWTCHNGKWFRGYALHTICDEQGNLWAWVITGANVQEMKVGKKLIRKLAVIDSATVQMVIADTGYDSEPLHQLVRRRLNAMLIAPVNLRGSRNDTWRQRQPGRDFAERILQQPEGRALMEKRGAIERWYSLFKGSSRVSVLPYHVRRLRRVRRWIDLKLMVFFASQSFVRKDLYAVA